MRTSQIASGTMLLLATAGLFANLPASYPGRPLAAESAAAIRGLDPGSAPDTDECAWFESTPPQVAGSGCFGMPDDVIECITCANGDFTIIDPYMPGYFHLTGTYNCDGAKHMGICRNNVCSDLVWVGTCNVQPAKGEIQ